MPKTAFSGIRTEVPDILSQAVARPKQRIPSIEELQNHGKAAGTNTTIEGLRNVVTSEKVQEIGKTLQDPKKKYSPSQMRANMAEIFEQYEVNPVEELIKIATERNDEGKYVQPPSMRASIWSDLLQYQLPKMKSIETVGEVDHKLTVVLQQFTPSGEGKREILTIQDLNDTAGKPVIDVTPNDQKSNQ